MLNRAVPWRQSSVLMVPCALECSAARFWATVIAGTECGRRSFLYNTELGRNPKQKQRTETVTVSWAGTLPMYPVRTFYRIKSCGMLFLRRACTHRVQPSSNMAYVVLHT